jgi:hypothetical protein
MSTSEEEYDDLEPMSEEDEEFVARVISASPTGELTPEQEDDLMDIILVIDREWDKHRLGTMKYNVISHFPWRELDRAPQLFADYISGQIDAANPTYEDYRYYHDYGHPIEKYLINKLVEFYEEQTGAGRWIETSIPQLRQQMEATIPPQLLPNFLGLLDSIVGGYGTLSDYDYARRWLLRIGVEDLRRTDIVRFFGSMIDYDIDKDQIEFPGHGNDPDYENIKEVIARVTGYWEDPRIIRLAYSLARKNTERQIGMEKAVNLILDLIYNIGKEAYERSRRTLRLAMARRLYAPGSRGAREAIAEVRGLATRPPQPHPV